MRLYNLQTVCFHRHVSTVAQSRGSNVFTYTHIVKESAGKSLESFEEPNRDFVLFPFKLAEVSGAHALNWKALRSRRWFYTQEVELFWLFVF